MRMLALIPVLFGVIGVGIGSFVDYASQLDSSPLAESQAYQPTLDTYEDNEQFLLSPTHISITSIGLDLDVKEASVSGNEWTIYDDAASWLVTSGNLESGNMVIYAHNKRSIFKELRELSVGDTIEVSNQHHITRFLVTEAFDGKATDLHHITDEATRLTLYTCSGLFDRDRFFVFAEPYEVETL